MVLTLHNIKGFVTICKVMDRDTRLTSMGTASIKVTLISTDTPEYGAPVAKIAADPTISIREVMAPPWSR